MNPVFSIIIPIYKAEMYINECIDSILNQSFHDFEVILINDGSPDRCGEICDEYVEKDERVKVIHKKNEGVSAARNDGMDLSTGAYLTFVDADDWIEPTMLMEIADAFGATNSDVIVTGLTFEYTQENYSVLRAVQKPINSNNRKEIGTAILSLGINSLIGYAANKVYRNDLIKQHGLRFKRKITYMEDILFNCEFFKIVNSISVIDKSYYHYMIRNKESLSSKYTPKLYATVQQVNKSMNELFELYNIKSLKYPATLSEGYVYGIQSCIYNIYHYKCNLNHKEKKTFIKEILEDKQFGEDIKNFRTKNGLDRLFVRLYKTKSPYLIDFIYTNLFHFRYSFQPIYRKISKRINQK